MRKLKVILKIGKGDKSMKLIMRADDLGFSEAVNLGIYKAVKEGVITSVGMMTNM